MKFTFLLRLPSGKTAESGKNDAIPCIPEPQGMKKLLAGASSHNYIKYICSLTCDELHGNFLSVLKSRLHAGHFLHNMGC